MWLADVAPSPEEQFGPLLLVLVGLALVVGVGLLIWVRRRNR